MIESGRKSLHALAEERSLAYHRIVASRLAEQPELVERALGRIEQWLVDAGRSRPYARRWRELLTGALPELIAVMIDEGEGARALRQATPFAGALDPRERWSLWREIRARRDGL